MIFATNGLKTTESKKNDKKNFFLLNQASVHNDCVNFDKFGLILHRISTHFGFTSAGKEKISLRTQDRAEGIFHYTQLDLIKS